MSEDIDEPDYLLLPCFQIDPDVKMKDVPTTGQEYLLKVIKERQNYKTVTTCNKDLSVFAANQSFFAQEVTKLFLNFYFSCFEVNTYMKTRRTLLQCDSNKTWRT